MTSLHSGSGYVRDVRLGTTQASAVYLGSTKIWPPPAPVLTTYSTAGSYTYNIPGDCDRVDAILLGGGQGGTGIGFGNGQGGHAGKWSTTTLVRGVDFPWAATTITGTVGAGGSGNGGGAGGSTTAIVTGGSTYTAVGGSGGMGVTVPGGEAAGTQAFNSQSYVGGGAQSSLGGVGVVPGGGGAGGGFGSSIGGGGAVGRAWFYAYSDSPPAFSPAPPNGVAYDATGSGATGSGSGTSYTAVGSHTSSGNAVVVAISVLMLAGTITSGTVTYGGQSMTQLGTATGSGGAGYKGYLFGLLNPPSGSQTVIATVGGTGLYGLAMSSVSYAGVTSFGTVATNAGSGTAPTQTVSSTTGKMVAQAFASFVNATISGYDQTQRLAAGTTTACVVQGDAAGAASITFNATINNSTPWTSITVDLNN